MSTALAPSPVALYCLPPIWGTPSPSPFVVKLMTWFRMADIAYRPAHLTRPPQSQTGKIPYVELPDGRILADSSLIIHHFSTERGVDLDAHLGSRERATGLAVQRLVEEHLYWCGVRDRWIEPEGYVHTARDYFRTMPPVVRNVLPLFVRRKIRSGLHGHGLGRHSAETVAAFAQSDAAALSAILGEREFMLGGPSNVDATVFAFLWAQSSTPVDCATRRAATGFPNLVAYTARMRARYWSDWASPG